MMEHPPTITFRAYRVNIWATIAYMYLLRIVHHIKPIEKAEPISHSVKMSGNYYVILFWVKIKWA